MEIERIIDEAKELTQELTTHRRWFHTNAETGFALERTCTYVADTLRSIGIEPVRCGKMGLLAQINGKSPGKTFLLRADMDALPIREESGEPFACGHGAMHACGHDMHTAMLLGAAKLLKAHSHEFRGSLRLMFQPAEELLLGAKDMIESGVLDGVNGAMMLHVVPGIHLPAGTPVVPDGGIGAPSADWFTIEVIGKGCHGATPQKGIDPITTAAHIILGLQAITSQELDSAENAVLTVGLVQAGQAANVIPDKAILSGTTRTYRQEVQNLLKTRIEQIAAAIGSAYRSKVQVTFSGNCPPFLNDFELCVAVKDYLAPLLVTKSTPPGSGGASEDFAFVSHKVPSIVVALAAGEPRNGYTYPLHHPKVRFDESALPVGSGILAGFAMDWLNKHESGV